jgi:hypothetical protein
MNIDIRIERHCEWWTREKISHFNLKNVSRIPKVKIMMEENKAPELIDFEEFWAYLCDVWLKNGAAFLLISFSIWFLHLQSKNSIIYPSKWSPFYLMKVFPPPGSQTHPMFCRTLSDISSILSVHARWVKPFYLWYLWIKMSQKIIYCKVPTNDIRG